jgi:signal transduction histidine kinase
MRFSRIDDLPPEASIDKETLRRYGPKSNVTVPLRMGKKVFGALAVGSVRQERTWSDEVVAQVELAGRVFANALERKRRMEEIRQAGAEIHALKEQLEQDIRDRRRAEEALRSSRSSVETLAGRLLTIQEEERRILARELHDDLTQRLAVQSIALGQVVGRRSAECRQCTARLAGIRDELAKLSEDIHAISRQLHPSILDDLGLADALRSECSAFSGREGIVISCHIEDLPASVPRDAAVCAYRIAQEGLRNVAKHARVKEAEVTLRREGGALVLTVRDAGVGFHVGNGTGTVGIASMAERARLVQGEFDVQSQPGKGTVVRVRIPLRSSRP